MECYTFKEIHFSVRKWTKVLLIILVHTSSSWSLLMRRACSLLLDCSGRRLDMNSPIKDKG